MTGGQDTYESTQFMQLFPPYLRNIYTILEVFSLYTNTGVSKKCLSTNVLICNGTEMLNLLYIN